MLHSFPFFSYHHCRPHPPERRQEKHGRVSLPPLGGSVDGRVSEELCAAAAITADALQARAVLCFTRRGFMPAYISRCRPNAPIFAFTGAQGRVATIGEGKARFSQKSKATQTRKAVFWCPLVVAALFP